MIGDALAAICSDPDVLARLGGPLGDAARAKAAELRRLPATARKAERARVAAIAHAPVPAGLRGIDPSWIEAALADLPPRARAELGTGGSSPAAIWLVRWAAARLAPMPPVTAARDLASAFAAVRPRSIHDATQLPATALVDWLEDVGADQLAFALGGEVAAVAANLAPALEQRVLAAAARIAHAPRAGQLGPRRAAIARVQVDGRVTPDDADRLLRIGSRAVAPYTDALIRRQLALRLPRTRGTVGLFAMRDRCHDPVDGSPTWAALAAD